MSVLAARDAYRLWAPTYAAETATSFLDEQLAREMLHDLPCERLLDAGCGTGRRLAGMEGPIGVDASAEMVAAGEGSAGFDMVWCRLVLGHLADPMPAYRELARVCRPGGHVFVTDFHPDAVAAGGRRSFRDQAGQVHEVEHHVHSDHAAFAGRAGLTLVERREASVGPMIRDFYVRAERLALYEKNRGLKLVAAFLFHRAG